MVYVSSYTISIPCLCCNENESQYLSYVDMLMSRSPRPQRTAQGILLSDRGEGLQCSGEAVGVGAPGGGVRRPPRPRVDVTPEKVKTG